MRVHLNFGCLNLVVPSCTSSEDLNYRYRAEKDCTEPVYFRCLVYFASFSIMSWWWVFSTHRAEWKYETQWVHGSKRQAKEFALSLFFCCWWCCLVGFGGFFGGVVGVFLLLLLFGLIFFLRCREELNQNNNKKIGSVWRLTLMTLVLVHKSLSPSLLCFVHPFRKRVT